MTIVLAILAGMPLGPVSTGQGDDALGLQWNKVAEGAEWAVFQGELLGAPRSVSVFRCLLSDFKAEVASDPGRGKDLSAKTSGFARRYGALAAINASYFNMKTLYPVTYVKDGGQVEGHTTASELSRTDGIVRMKRHRVEISFCDTLGYARATRRWPEAIASGPVLIVDGKVRNGWPEGGFFTGSHPRSVVGTADGWLYLVVIDGRFPEAQGTTIAETAQICRLLGMKDAINLDGGGSSALWVSGPGVISHPSDNHTFDNRGERTVPNAIIVHQ